MLVWGLNLEIAAFSLTECIPYFLALSASGVSGYKLYKDKESKGAKFSIKDLSAYEWLPYAAVTGATAYGLYTHYTMSSSTKNLEHKLGNARQAMKQVSLAHLQTCIEELEKKYEVPLINDQLVDTGNEAQVLYHVLRGIVASGRSIDSVESSFSDDIKILCMCKSTLEITVKDEMGSSSREDAKDRLIFDAIGQKLIYSSGVMIGYIEKLAIAFREHKNFFILENALLQSAHYDYAEERKIVKASLDSSLFGREMEGYINKRYSGTQYQFPYLTYASYLEEGKLLLEKALRNLELYKSFQFQSEVIMNARDTVTLLNFLLQHVVNSEIYKYQKAQKPLFDRNEERHRQELHEKQRAFEAALHERAVQLENEQKATETKLLEERNRERNVENQRMSLENSLVQQQLEKQKMKFQSEAFKSGKQIQRALDKNNKEWAATCEKLRNQLKVLQETQEAHEFIISSSEKEREAWALMKMNLNKELEHLEDALNVPPAVTSEDAQGVTNYLNLLKWHLTQVRQSINE